MQQSRLSIIKSADSGEDWVEEAVLPIVHVRGIYAAAWSQKTGRIVSSGSDGMVVVYQEEWFSRDKGTETTLNGDQSDGSGGNKDVEERGGMDEQEEKATRWRNIAQIEAAHGVFEVNHVAWARRPKPRQGAQEADEERELVITTGDDGAVKVWELKR